MMIHRWFMVLGIVGIMSVPCVAWDESPCVYNFQALDEFLEGEVGREGMAGFSLLLLQHGEVIYDQSFGTFAEQAAKGEPIVVPIGSGAKLLAGAVVTSVVQDGLISLDATVGEMLGWEGINKPNITLRHLMTHTSGIPGIPYSAPCLRLPDITMEQCVAEIELLELIAVPGRTFNYGGTSMQVAGYMCELASGQSWNELFENRVKVPLGMTLTSYQLNDNPRVAGGASSTAYDLAKLLQVYLDGGTCGQTRIFDETSMKTILSDQTFGAPRGVSYPEEFAPDPFIGYGMGIWIDKRDSKGHPMEFSCSGAYGTVPWIDVRRDLVGVFLVYSLYGYARPTIEGVRERVPYIIDTYSIADYEYDCDLDLIDFAYLQNCFTGPNAGPVPEECALSDLDGDDDIDRRDYAIFQRLISGPKKYDRHPAFHCLAGNDGGDDSMFDKQPAPSEPNP